MRRRFRAFYLAAFAVSLVGLVGSWSVANKPVAPPSDLTTVALDTSDTGSHTSPLRAGLFFEPPIAMLAVPEFFLKPTEETACDFGQTSDVTPETDTDYAVLFGESSLP